MLTSYDGNRNREHLGAHGPPHTLRCYGADTTGSKRYHFNSLGFRGEDYDPRAEKLLFVCGCSRTFGTGLNQEETWGHLFKEQYAEALGIPSTRVNLLNFSQGGASNDYIARTLLSQCAGATPDVMLILLTNQGRSERIYEEEGREGRRKFFVQAIMPWMPIKPIERLPPRFQPATDAERSRMEENLAAATHFYALYNDALGMLQTIKNILLLQSFCASREIEYTISWAEWRSLEDPSVRQNPFFAPLIKLIDFRRLCNFSLTDPDFYLDASAEGVHPGPRSHQKFAQRLFEVYLELRTPPH